MFSFTKLLQFCQRNSISWCVLLKKHYGEKAKLIFFKKLRSGCTYLLDLIAIFFFLHSLRNFCWIPLLFIFIFIEETNQFRIMFSKKTNIFRNSCSQKIFEIGILKNFAIFTGKHLCWNLSLTMLQSLHQIYCWKNLWIRLQNYKYSKVATETYSKKLVFWTLQSQFLKNTYNEAHF